MHLLTLITSLALAMTSAYSMLVPILQSDDEAVAELKNRLLYYGLDSRDNPDSLAMRMVQEGIMAAESNANNIPEVAKDKLGLTTLVDLVVKANLTDALEGKSTLTLFGPTNAAFDNLPDWAKQVVKNVTVLTKILTFHVIAGAVNSSQLKNELVVNTVANKPLRVNIYDNKVYTVQCAPIDLKQVDVKADNGLIHVLNSVMIPPAGTAVEALSECPAFTILVTAVKKAGLVATLSGDGPFTVFAPTDKAFGKLPPGTLEKLLKNPDELKKILLYHVVSGTACSAGLQSGTVPTVNGQDVKIMVSKDGVKVNDAKVIVADGSITNGVVHAIDTVLLPKQLPYWIN